jgi:pyruvate dehydrogenase phosphatase
MYCYKQTFRGLSTCALSISFAALNKCHAETNVANKSKSSYFSYNANDPIEDRYIFDQSVKNWKIVAVFDGHGGWNVADYASKVFVRELESSYETCAEDCEAKTMTTSLFETFDKIESAALKVANHAFKFGYGNVVRVGSCALIACFNKNTILVANLGDCRAVLASKNPLIDCDTYVGPKSQYVVTRLTGEHNARVPLEVLKLKTLHPDEDNIVICKNPHACYVKGRLQLTRAFGDFYLKYSHLNAPPNAHSSM